MSRFATSAKSPMNMSIAAGVAGTVAVTGTVVAVASDQPTRTHIKPVALTTSDFDLSTTSAQQARHAAVAQVQGDAARSAAQARLAAARKKAHDRTKAAARRAAQARSHQVSGVSRSYRRVDEHTSASAAHVLDLAAAQSGDSYAYGGDGPDAFDCSGFTMYVFNLVGISLPHSAAAQSSIARPVSQPQPGDLVFVHNGGGGSIGHVAIYAGGGYWYEASHPGIPVGKHRAWSTNVTFGRVL
jgi:cell wall-associated NlpC family hydrolase